MVKNRLKCSDFKYANYKFVVSLYIYKRFLPGINYKQVKEELCQKRM